MSHKLTDLLLLVVTVSAALMLSVGCGKPPAGQTLIRYARWGLPEEIESERQLIAQFEATHPGIKVKLEYASWAQYWTKIQAQLAAHEAPDVILMTAMYLQDFAKRNQLVDLAPMLKADPALKLDQYYASPVEGLKIDQKLYGLPRDCNTVGIYYNKTLFENRGVPLPTADWTWADLRNAAKQLTFDDNKDGRMDCWGFLAGYQTIEVEWGYWVEQNGGAILNPERTHCLLDQPAAAEALKFLHAFVVDGLSPGPADTGGFGTGIDMFTVGRIAMVAAGSWGVKSFSTIEKFKWDIAPLPRGKVKAAPSNGLGYAIYQGSKQQAAAWELAKFLVSEPAQRQLAKSGTSIPALRAVAESADYLDGKPAGKQFFLEQLGYGQPLPCTENLARWETAIRDQLELVWLGKQTMDDGLKAATRDVDAILAKNTAPPASQ
jgi:multiple sugar transport system substrate-binding protein